MSNESTLGLLVAHEASVRRFFEESPDAIFVHQDHVLRYVNPALVTLLGRGDASELVGEDFVSLFVHPDDQARVRALSVAGADHRLECSVRVRWVRADGAEIVTEGGAMQVSFGGELAALVRARDVTATVQMQVALAQSEARHRQLFESMPLPAWMAEGESMRILEANDVAVRLYGYGYDEMLTMTLADLQDPTAGGAFLARVKALQPDCRVTGLRRHRKKDGSIFEVSTSATSMSFEGRRVVLLTAMDVTESRRLEEQLRQSQKMEAIGRLAGGIAHDFNNILAVILSGLDLASSALEEAHPARREIHDAAASARRAANLTRQLLAFSRQQPAHKRVVSLNSLVAEMQQLLSRVVGEDVALSLAMTPQLSAIEADPSHLEQVVMNLVVNARDAMPRGGVLRVSTDNVVLAEAEAAELGVSEGSYVKLTVADTGVGMDAATRARVFEPFFTTKEVGQGTGLGLSTVFGIVKQSGGAISVESAPGQGASFHLHFPAVDDAPASVHPPVQRRDVQAGHERILLVEDDEALRAVIRRVLVARGYHVTDVCAPDMAIRYFRAHAREVDLVVTDMVMPETDGRVLVEQLRVEHPSLKVLFMSGYSEARVTDGGSIPLGDHFIQKPFTAQEIAAAVRRAIDHSTGAQS